MRIEEEAINSTTRLIKSSVEYLDYIWGFYRGCKYQLSGVCLSEENCSEEEITERSRRYHPDIEPVLFPEAFPSPLHLREPSRIGMSFMGDLFGDWINPESAVFSWDTPSLKSAVFKIINECPQHIFVFISRNPSNLERWSPFPENCWVGMSATDYAEARWAARGLRKIEAGVRFLSFEPLLAPAAPLPSTLVVSGITWVTVGAQTNPYQAPDIGWVEEIVEVCDTANVPVFLKSNLERAFFEQSGIDRQSVQELFRNKKLGAYRLRQELPRCRGNALLEV